LSVLLRRGRKFNTVASNRLIVPVPCLTTAL
jgi:hypothetical protein